MTPFKTSIQAFWFLCLTLILVNMGCQARVRSLPTYFASSSHSSIVLTASSTNTDATPVTTSTITVTLINGENNPISGDPVTLVASTNPYPANGLVITPTTATTNGSGQATFTATSTQTGVVIFTATDGIHNVSFNSGSITLGQMSPTFSQVLVSNSKFSIPADNSTAAQIQVTILDPGQNPLPGHTVSLTSSHTTDTVSPTTAVTNSYGQASFTVTSGTPTTALNGYSVLTAIDTTAATTLQYPAQLVFYKTGTSPTPPQGANANSYLLVNNVQFNPSGSQLITLTTVVLDPFGYPISGDAVNTTSQNVSNSTAISQSPASNAPTDTTGSSSITITSTTANDPTYTTVANTPSGSGTPINKEVSFNFIPSATPICNASLLGFEVNTSTSSTPNYCRCVPSTTSGTVLNWMQVTTDSTNLQSPCSTQVTFTSATPTGRCNPYTVGTVLYNINSGSPLFPCVCRARLDGTFEWMFQSTDTICSSSTSPPLPSPIMQPISGAVIDSTTLNTVFNALTAGYSSYGITPSATMNPPPIIPCTLSKHLGLLYWIGLFANRSQVLCTLGGPCKAGTFCLTDLLTQQKVITSTPFPVLYNINPQLLTSYGSTTSTQAGTIQVFGLAAQNVASPTPASNVTSDSSKGIICNLITTSSPNYWQNSTSPTSCINPNDAIYAIQWALTQVATLPSLQPPFTFPTSDYQRIKAIPFEWDYSSTQDSRLPQNCFQYRQPWKFWLDTNASQQNFFDFRTLNTPSTTPSATTVPYGYDFVLKIDPTNANFASSASSYPNALSGVGVLSTNPYLDQNPNAASSNAPWMDRPPINVWLQGGTIHGTTVSRYQALCDFNENLFISSSSASNNIFKDCAYGWTLIARFGSYLSPVVQPTPSNSTNVYMQLSYQNPAWRSLTNLIPSFGPDQISTDFHFDQEPYLYNLPNSSAAQNRSTFNPLLLGQSSILTPAYYFAPIDRQLRLCIYPFNSNSTLTVYDYAALNSNQVAQIPTPTSIIPTIQSPTTPNITIPTSACFDFSIITPSSSNKLTVIDNFAPENTTPQTTSSLLFSSSLTSSTYLSNLFENEYLTNPPYIGSAAYFTASPSAYTSSASTNTSNFLRNPASPTNLYNPDTFSLTLGYAGNPGSQPNQEFAQFRDTYTTGSLTLTGLLAYIYDGAYSASTSGSQTPTALTYSSHPSFTINIYGMGISAVCNTSAAQCTISSTDTPSTTATYYSDTFTSSGATTGSTGITTTPPAGCGVGQLIVWLNTTSNTLSEQIVCMAGTLWIN